MPPALKEPITSFTAVLFSRQADYIRETAEKRGVKRMDVLREVVELGIEAHKEAADESEGQAA